MTSSDWGDRMTERGEALKRQREEADAGRWRGDLAKLRGRTITGYATHALGENLHDLTVTLDNGDWFQLNTRPGPPAYVTFALYEGAAESGAMNDPEHIPKPERVRSGAFARMRRLAREHPCPECGGRRKPCSTCKGTRIDPAFAVWDDDPKKPGGAG